MTASHISCFLAQAAPAVSSPALVGNWIVALAILSPIASLGVAVVFGVLNQRRRPPLGEMLHADFATKEEVDAIRNDSSASIRRVHERIDELTRQVNASHADSERARGLMLGKLESITEQLKQLHDDFRQQGRKS